MAQSSKFDVLSQLENDFVINDRNHWLVFPLKLQRHCDRKGDLTVVMQKQKLIYDA